MFIFRYPSWVAILPLGLIALMLVGCSDGSLNTCEGLERWVKDLSAESEGWQPMHAIYEIEEVSRTETRVDCTGRAKMQDGSSIQIAFYNLIDSDGDFRYGFGVARRPTAVPSPAANVNTATLKPTSTPPPTPVPTPTMTAEQQLEKTVQSVDWIQTNAIDLLAFDYKDCPNVSYRLQAEAAVLFRSTNPLTEMAYRHHIGEEDVYPPHWQAQIADMEAEMRNILSQLRGKGCGP